MVRELGRIYLQVYIYEHSNSPENQKCVFRKPRKLFIGGIFPMSGEKYVAPELALGNRNNVNVNPSSLECISGKDGCRCCERKQIHAQ